MSEGNLRFDIPFKKNGYINIYNVLDEASEITYNGSGYESKSLLNQRVQSMVGKVIEGYNDDEGFIDDSGVVDPHATAKKLDLNSFKVSLEMPHLATLKPESSKDFNDDENSKNVDERLEPFIERINVIMAPSIDDYMLRIYSGKPAPNITIPEEAVKAIYEAVEEKVRIESDGKTGISKKKVDGWKKDAINFIYSKCFEANDNKFTTVRRLQNAYTKYCKKKDEVKGDEESVDE